MNFYEKLKIAKLQITVVAHTKQPDRKNAERRSTQNVGAISLSDESLYKFI